jgi:hypothetical protein
MDTEQAETKLVGDNKMLIEGELYEFQITGEADVTPGPVRRVILDALLASVDPEMAESDTAEVVMHYLNDLSCKIMNELDARFNFVPKEGIL